MKKIATLLIKIGMHLVAVASIIIAFIPIAKWYFVGKPLWGVDFFYTASLVKMLQTSYVFPAANWFYAWFNGWPWVSSYPILHSYAIVPFTLFFDFISAVKIWMLVTLGLYFIGEYAVFFVLSGNVILSALLSIATSYSIGVYGTLMWGGSLPSHATQLFFPWVIFFLLLYLRKRVKRYLMAAALLTGLAIWGHPQVVIAYIYPSAALLMFFSFGFGKLWSRIKTFAMYFIISFLIGLPLFYSVFGDALKVLVVTHSQEVASSTARMPSDEAKAIENFHKAQPWRIYDDTNNAVFILLGAAFAVFAVGFLIKRKSHQLIELIPFIVIAVYYVIYIVIFSYGISIYHGGWYRLFWATPFWQGMVVAVLWGVGQHALWGRPGKLGMITKSLVPLLSLAILLGGGYLIYFFSAGIYDRIIPRSNPSSAFPDVVNLRDGKGLVDLAKEMVPNWLPGNNTNYRLFSSDQTVNIWWNALFTMPLARGYFDPPVSAKHRGFNFWLDASLSQDTKTGKDQLVGSFHYPPEIAANNTLFLVDWYAVKYFEAGHAGPTVFAPLPASFVTADKIAHDSILDFNKEKYNKGNQTLHFFEAKDEIVSPILTTANASTLGIVASDDGFETVIRGLADGALGMRKIIPINLGKDLDKLNSSALTPIDGLLIYDYQYYNKGKAFGTLKKFVEDGKNIYIDTGTEVNEGHSEALPDLFPFNKSMRTTLGREWDFEVMSKDWIGDADVLSFDPPLFDNAEWNFSYPTADAVVASDTETILKNHGKAIVMSRKLGKGQIIWSGMNLPYHVIRFHNTQEVNFYKNILSKTVQLGEKPIETADVSFISPQKRVIKINPGSRGVLFKEQAYPGWSANITGKRNTSLPIYIAGPAYPGFMYVAIPKDMQGNTLEVTFTYSGSLKTCALTLFSIILVLLTFEQTLFGGFVYHHTAGHALSWGKSKMSKWWEKEEDKEA